MDLRGRDFLKELDLSKDELVGLVDLAAELKAAKREHREQQRLVGRNVALVFEKTSTRTRAAFDVAAADQGAHATLFDPAGSQIGHKESIADTGRVLARMFDAIQYRGSAQDTVEELAAAADVPVYNGLTDEWHPTQMLADLLTMREAGRVPVEELSYAYLGDARFNMGRSLLITGAIVGADVRLAAPKSYWPDPALIDQARAIADSSGAVVTVTEDLEEALAGAAFVHTDVWVSMGEPKEVWDERIEALLPYRVDARAMALAGPHARFLHCLPAYHDLGTSVGREVADRNGMRDGLEVSGEVFDSPANLAFDQAENRLHTIKALLVATLAD